MYNNFDDDDKYFLELDLDLIDLEILFKDIDFTKIFHGYKSISYRGIVVNRTKDIFYVRIKSIIKKMKNREEKASILLKIHIEDRTHIVDEIIIRESIFYYNNSIKKFTNRKLMDNNNSTGYNLLNAFDKNL